MNENRILFTRFSSNAKTGPCAVSLSSKHTCPPACALRKICYAATGALNIHWQRVTQKKIGITWSDFLKEIRRLHFGEIWRHNQGGDLEGTNNKIDSKKLRELIAANSGKKAICYTHYPVLSGQAPRSTILANRKLIKEANSKGFTINLSANNLKEADQLSALKIAPVVGIVPSDYTKNGKTPANQRTVVCPASIRDNVTCHRCGLCARAKRDYVIVFPAHGTFKNKINSIAAV